MSIFPRLSIFVSLALVASVASGRGVDLASMQLEAAIQTNTQGIPDGLAGKVTLKLGKEASELCFLLPSTSLNQNGPSIYNPIKYLENTTLAKNLSSAPGREVSIPANILGAVGESQASAIVKFKLKLPRNEFELPFTTTFNTKEMEGKSDFLFEGFYPSLLSECPLRVLDAGEISQLVVPMHIEAEIRRPDGWTIAGPFDASKANTANKTFLESYGRNVAFAMAKHYYEKVLPTNEGRVHFFGLEPNFFESFEETIQGALQNHTQWLGFLPFTEIAVVQSSLGQRGDLPGIIVVSRPRQYLFDYLQRNVLNLQHWTLSALVAAQWYGAMINVERVEDEWLLAGITDFVNLEFFRAFPKRYDLFNMYDKDFTLLSMDYLQMQEATAGLVRRFQPESRLTDTNLHSVISNSKHKSLLFVKQAFVLRYLKSLLGKEKLGTFLRTYTKESLFQSVTPASFHGALKDLSYGVADARKMELQSYVRDWWTSPSWPNLSLLSFDKKVLGSGQWLASATFAQNADLMLPSQVSFEDKNGQSHLVQGVKSKEMPEEYRADVITEAEPESVTLDPYHNIYDSDRFDNSSIGPGIGFFPGSAKTLSDKDYTVFWLPYLARLPSEGISFVLRAAVYRYLNTGLHLKLEWNPVNKDSAYSLGYEHIFSQPGLRSLAFLEKTYEGRNTAAASLNKDTSLLAPLAELSASSVLRLKQQSGQPQTRHPTISAGLLLKPTFLGRRCDLGLLTEREETMGPLSAPFSYYRQKARTTLNCQPFQLFDVRLRYFTGIVHAYHGDLPELVQFKLTDLSETAVRLDETRLYFATHVDSGTFELLLPFAFPLPDDLLILSKDLKLRLFYDIGRGLVANQNLLFRAAGVGIDLPFGGDLMGIGTLTVSKFSLLTVLYTQVGSKVSLRPHILWDFSGEL